MSSALGLRAWTQQPRHNVQAILELFDKMNTLLAEKKHFEEVGGNVDARLGHAEFQVRVRPFRATHQAARETLQTVNEPAAFLQAYFVEIDASKAACGPPLRSTTTTSTSCSRVAPCTWLMRIVLWMLSLLAQIG